MKYWLDHGMEELYFFMYMHDQTTSPELTVYLVDQMNKEMGLNLIKPKFIEGGVSEKKKPKQRGLLDENLFKAPQRFVMKHIVTA